MGAQIFYDAMHPVPKPEQNPGKTKRQVEVFTHGNELWLRMGPVGDKDEGKRRYTARVTASQVSGLINALESGLRFLGAEGR
jgi:hypothetical protein